MLNPLLPIPAQALNIRLPSVRTSILLVWLHRPLCTRGLGYHKAKHHTRFADKIPQLALVGKREQDRRTITHPKRGCGEQGGIDQVYGDGVAEDARGGLDGGLGLLHAALVRGAAEGDGDGG